MNNTVENDFFWFSNVKWLHLIGEVDKCVSCSCQILSWFNIPGYQKLKSVNFRQSYSKNEKVDVFWNAVYGPRPTYLQHGMKAYCYISLPLCHWLKARCRMSTEQYSFIYEITIFIRHITWNCLPLEKSAPRQIAPPCRMVVVRVGQHEPSPPDTATNVGR